MLKWKVLAVAGVVFGVAGLSWGYAQQQTFPGFYELRIYKAQPGKRDALAARFANRTAAIYARHAITNVGYFIPQLHRIADDRVDLEELEAWASSLVVALGLAARVRAA